MNKEPTQEQIREFWEWCGFQPTDDMVGVSDKAKFYYPVAIEPQRLWYLPPIDLNNLFLYAEFQAVIKMGIELKISISDARRWLFKQWADNIDKGFKYTDALFWALWQVKEAK